MSIDLTREIPIPLVDVPKLPWIPGRRPGQRIHLATVHRWCSHGIRGHRLEYVQAGGTRVTTEAALLRFFAKLTGPDTAAPQLSKQRKREQERVKRELDAAGF